MQTVELLPPVASVLDELLVALARAPQVLLNAPTGAGKSTWLPLQLLQSGQFSGRIIMLEPRRLAARNIAQRLAECLNEQPGGQTGYRMRAESCIGANTRLEVVTEGVLTRLLQDDPMLTGVSLVILDEFHERSLHADVALALLLDMQQALREDLKLLIMSATLDNTALSRLLPDAPVISARGRVFPVERRFTALPGQLPFADAVAAMCASLLAEEHGSLLVFLPGVGEIQRVQQALAERLRDDIQICPLYGALSLAEQRRAIAPASRSYRKVVLATNIAQTSLTIEGIRLVVDCALERVARFDPRTGLSRLCLQRISQAAMVQRAGRAGRLEAGICLHLISQQQAERAAEHSEPQILHSELSGLVMDVTQWGCQQVDQLCWLDRPPAANLAAAYQLLQQLGALHNRQLSGLGQRMIHLGSEPRLACMLSKAGSADEQATAARLAAILEEPPHQTDGDLSYLLTQQHSRWQTRAAQLLQKVTSQSIKLQKLMPQKSASAASSATMQQPALIQTSSLSKASGSKGRCQVSLAAGVLATAFADRIALRRNESSGVADRYQLANGTGATLTADNPLSRYRWLIAPALLQTDSAADARILLALPADIDELLAQQPSLLQQTDSVQWLAAHGTLQAVRRWQIGQLLVRSQPLEKPGEQQLHQALLTGIREQGLSLLHWTEQAQQLRLRLLCAARYLPDYAWPAMDDATLLQTLEQWLLPHMNGLHSLAALKKLDVLMALESQLDWSLRQCLNNELPSHYRLPAGRLIAIRYHADNPPVLAVRVQEMYGQNSTPCIARGRVPLTLELLSPAQRPLQITSDLAAFWQNAWRQVQKEMKGRYPKHLWPDDPANTVPVGKTKGKTKRHLS